MGDTHVLSGLVNKRARLSGELDALKAQVLQLRGEISTLDYAIHIFDPDYKVKEIKTIRKKQQNKFFETGERTRAIIDVLRDAPVDGLSVRQIATAISKERGMDLSDSDFKKLVGTVNDGLRRPMAKGQIREVSRANGTPRYLIKD